MSCTRDNFCATKQRIMIVANQQNSRPIHVGLARGWNLRPSNVMRLLSDCNPMAQSGACDWLEDSKASGHNFCSYRTRCVSGHDFSRAVIGQKDEWALAPAITQCAACLNLAQAVSACNHRPFFSL
jgi:hypothetical protein